MYTLESEGVFSGLQVLADLYDREVKDILITACTPKFKSFKEAISTMFP